MVYFAFVLFRILLDIKEKNNTGQFRVNQPLKAEYLEGMYANHLQKQYIQKLQLYK